MSDGCPFCEKLTRLDDLPAGEVVWRFAHSVAYLGPWQFYRGYCVLASKTHAREMIHLPEDVRRAYLDEMCLLSAAIERAFAPLKLNHELLGNQVNHPHWHLFPRYASDPARLKPVWLALDAAERDEGLSTTMKGDHDRAATAEAIRAALRDMGATGG